MLGSTETILPYAENYLGIILLGAPFMASSLVLNNQMRFQGNAVYAMIGIIIGAVINIGLDPLLIFVFDMGVSGAALSTVISQICSFMVLIYMDSKGTNIKIKFRNFTPSFNYLKEITFGGIPSLRNVNRDTNMYVHKLVCNWIRPGVPACLWLQLWCRSLQACTRRFLLLCQDRCNIPCRMFGNRIYICP